MVQTRASTNDNPLSHKAVCDLGAKRKKRRVSIPTNRDDTTEEMRFALPQKNDTSAIRLIMTLNDALRKPKTRRYIETLIARKDPSVRRIQGGRYEIFVESTFKQTTAFDKIVADMGVRKFKMDAKERILRFCKRKAVQSNAQYGVDYSFNNFSILVNYEECAGQAPHIDLLRPNAQFGLTITDQSPRTLCYSVSSNIGSASDLMRVGWPEMSENLQTVMKRKESPVFELLQNFGNVLHKQMTESDKRPLRVGTLASLPGGIIHAGPPCQHYRAILFFSGHPANCEISEYEPDTQYFSPLLVADIIYHMWFEITVDDRIYMLKRLLEYVGIVGNESNKGKVHGHLQKAHALTFFLEAIEERGLTRPTTTKDEREREDFIRLFAAIKFRDCPKINGQFLPPLELVLVSVEGLHLEWRKNEWYPATVYKCLSNLRRQPVERDTYSVLIYYQTDNSWEGGGRGGYALHLPTTDPFDGENGCLKDSDGNTLHCRFSTIH